MPVRIRPARASFNGRASNGDARLDNRLASVDHGLFEQHHAIGRKLVMQLVWVYEHAVDLDGLRRFQYNLGHGLLARRIERSALPFARNRWVSDRGRRTSISHLTVCAYQPGAENTKPALRELARTLAEFDLTGEID